MSRQKAPANTLTARFIKGYLLLLAMLSGFAGKVPGQETLDLTKPFKECRSYGANNGLLRIIASDNVSEIILTNGDFKLISIDPRSRNENWISEAGGRLETETISDGKRLFFLTSVVDKDNSKIFTLNSISLQTGIAVWQKKIKGFTNVRLYPVQDEGRVFLISESKLLSIVDRASGNVLWKIEFPRSIISVGDLSGNYLSVLTEDSLYRVSGEDGSLVEGWKFSSKSFNRVILDDDYMLLGYPTGEVAKVSSSADKKRVFWKIKTGGSVSGLYKLKDGILVSSLDNFLYLFSVENGSVRWKRRVSGRINIDPLIYGNYAIVLSSADNLATVVDLSDGKVVNQIKIEDGNYFSGQPLVFGNQLILQTYRGVYFFVNASLNCP